MTRVQETIKASIHYPDGHHSWALDLNPINKEEKQKIIQLISACTIYPIRFDEPIELSKVKASRPFIQGNDDDWMRVEFWAEDQNILLDAMLYIASIVNAEWE